MLSIFFLPSTLFGLVGLCLQGEQFSIIEMWVLVWITYQSDLDQLVRGSSDKMISLIFSCKMKMF